MPKATTRSVPGMQAVERIITELSLLSSLSSLLNLDCSNCIVLSPLSSLSSLIYCTLRINSRQTSYLAEIFQQVAHTYHACIH